MNIVILLAILIQSGIRSKSRLIAAIFGLLITSGILFWGWTVYDDGDVIALFGTIELSFPIFLILILVWFGFDIVELIGSINQSKQVSDAYRDQTVDDFYAYSRSIWSQGTLDELNKGFTNLGKMDADAFFKQFPPFNGSSLFVFFRRYQPLEGEYLIAHGDLNNEGWFVLTNQRLIQKNGVDNNWVEIMLNEVEDHELTGKDEFTMKFRLVNGANIKLEKVMYRPTDVYLAAAISNAPKEITQMKPAASVSDLSEKYLGKN